MAKKEKTIYDLVLHETMNISESIDVVKDNGEKVVVIKKYEVTRVAGGWVYAFDYPMFRQSPIVFVPFNNEFMPSK